MIKGIKECGWQRMSIKLYQQSDTQRRLDEPETKTHFSQFRRDYARLIHSASFRRLQGKTQIYPGFESDFFRNRLTHSLEVSQVAKSISIMLNEQYKLDIDYDLVETAALCHDIGHPPFGHNGERALHEKMRESGGFEGNAQTLRLLAITEKKLFKGNKPIENGIDNRLGLNLTYRTMASVLKYDKKIPEYIVSESPYPIKGYYTCETDLVTEIKANVLKGFDLSRLQNTPFKTIECYIMDLADDIAYSTYDIEDAFKGGFLDPLSMVCADESLLKKVQVELNRSENVDISLDEIREILKQIFRGFIDFDREDYNNIYQKSKELAETGYLRTQLTSSLVHSCISNVEFELNEYCPLLSKVYLGVAVRKQVEVLKIFIYIAVISSPRMNIIRYRGREILSRLFDLLIDSQPDSSLLPSDIGAIFFAFDEDDPINRKRVICDFISSMTDRYAVELYNRFESDMPYSLFKPL